MLTPSVSADRGGRGERRIGDQRLPVHVDLASHVDRGIDPLPRLAQPGDAGAFVAKQELRHVPAFVLLVNPHRDRHPDVVEEHFVQMVATIDRNDRPHRDAGRFHVHQQERNTLLPFARVRVGADQDKTPIGVMRGGGPDLLPVHHVMIAVQLRGGLQRCEIGTSAGLGETLAPPIVQVRGARQKTLFLLLGAELQQYWADHRDVERGQLRRRRHLVFFQKDHLLDRGPAGSAPFLRPGQARPAFGVENTLPAHGVFLAGAVAEFHLGVDVGGQVLADERAHLLTERDLFRCEAQIHGWLLLLTGSLPTPLAGRNRGGGIGPAPDSPWPSPDLIGGPTGHLIRHDSATGGPDEPGHDDFGEKSFDAISNPINMSFEGI